MSTTSALHRACTIDDLPPLEGRRVRVDGADVAIFRCARAVLAVANTCPHAGGPLADGIVAGETVTCPLHGRVVDLRSGEVSDCEDRVPIYRVVVDEGVVYVEGRPA
jgi:nitrite reductase (NADH) small subunit